MLNDKQNSSSQTFHSPQHISAAVTHNSSLVKNGYKIPAELFVRKSTSDWLRGTNID